MSETSYNQSQTHFDVSVESIADSDLEDSELQKMLTETSLNKCIGEIQQQMEKQRLTLQYAQDVHSRSVHHNVHKHIWSHVCLAQAFINCSVIFCACERVRFQVIQPHLLSHSLPEHEAPPGQHDFL